MSWAADEWKDGLPPAALQKITQLETQFGKLKKERDQKQCQLESLEVALQNQKRKTEEEKSHNLELQRENKTLAESCDEIQRKHAKLQQDLHIKDNQIFLLDGKLSYFKQTLEGNSGKAEQSQLRIQLEQLQQEKAQLVLEKSHLSEQLQSAKAADRNNVSDYSMPQELSSFASTLPAFNHETFIKTSGRSNWDSGDWKENLSPKVQQHLDQLEQQVDKLKKERDQKQCQLDSLDQALQNQKRKTEEERAKSAALQRELMSLSETCEDLEKKRTQFQHELNSRDNQISFLTGQMTQTKSVLEKELSKSQADEQCLQGELTRLQKEVHSLEFGKRELLEKITSANQIMQTHSNIVSELKAHVDATNIEKESLLKKLEESQNEVKKLTEEVQTLRSSEKQQKEQNDQLRATLMDKDLCLENALASSEHFKSLTDEKESQLKSTASELQSVKAEMIELMKTSESKLNALKEELNSKLQKTEMQLAEKQNELTNQTDEITSLKKELDKVRHCFTELTSQHDQIRKLMQDLQIEKVEMETSCHRLEDELSMTKQQAMKKDEAHATTLSNMQVKCRDLENALTESKKDLERVCENQQAQALLLQAVQEERSHLLSQKEHMNGTLSHTENSLSSFQQRCSELEKTEMELRKSLELAETELEACRNELLSKAKLLTQKDCQLADTKSSWNRVEDELRRELLEKSSHLTEMGLQLEKANSELANLHAELKHFMEQRDENLISIEKKEAEMLQLRTEIKQLNQELEELMEKLESTKENMQDQEKTYIIKRDNLQKSLKAKTEEADSLQASLERLTEEFSQANQALSKKCEELVQSLQKLNDDKVKCEHMATELEMQREALKLELDLSKQTNQQCQVKLDMLQMDLDDGDDMMESLRNQLAQENQAITDLKHRLEEKEKLLTETLVQVELVGQKLTESLGNSASLDVQVQELKLHSSQLDVALQGKISQLENLNSDLNGVRDQLAILHQQIFEKETTEAELREQIKQSAARVEELLCNLSHTKEALHLKEEEISELMETCAKQGEQLETQARLLALRDIDIQASQDQMRELVESLADESRSKQAEKDRLETELSKLGACNEELQSELDTVRKELSEGQLCMSNLESKRKLEISKLINEKEQLITDKQALMEYQQHLECQVEKGNLALKELEHKLDNLRLEHCHGVEQLQHSQLEVNETKKSLAEKCDTIAELSKQVEFLEKELAENREKAFCLETEFRSKFQNLDQERQSFISEKETLFNHLEVADKKLQEFALANEQLQHRHDCLHQEYLLKEGQCQTLEKDVTDGQKHLKNMQALVDELSVDINNLKEKNSNSLLDIEMYQHKILSLEDEQNSKTCALEDTKKILEDVSLSNETLSVKVSQMEKELTDQKASFKSLEDKLLYTSDEHDKEKLSLLQEKDELINSLDLLQANLLEKDIVISELKNKLEILSQELQNSARQLKESKESTDSKMAVVMDLTEKLDIFEAEKKALTDESLHLKSNIESYLLKIASLEKQIAFKQCEFDQANQSLTALQATVDELTTHINQLKDSMSENSRHHIDQQFESSKRIEKLENELTQLTSSMKDKDEAINELHLENDALTAQLKTISGTLKDSQALFKEEELMLKSKLKDADARILDLLNQLDHESACIQKAELETEERKALHDKVCQDYDKQIEILTKEKSDLDYQLSALRVQVSACHASLADLEQKLIEESKLSKYLKHKEEEDAKLQQASQKKLEGTIKTLECQLSEVQQKLVDAEQSKDVQIASTNLQMEDLKCELNATINRLHDTERKNQEELQITLFRLQKVEEDYKEAEKEFSNQRVVLQHEIECLQGCCQALKDAKDHAATDVALEIARLKRELELTRGEKDVALVNNDILTEKLELTKSELEMKSQELETIGTTLESVKLQLRSKEDDLVCMEDRYKLDLVDKIREMEKSSAQLAFWETELKSLQEKLSETISTVEDKNREMSAIYAEKESLVLTLSDAQASVELAHERNELLEQKLAELSQNRSFIESDKFKAESELRQYKEELELAQSNSKKIEEKAAEIGFTLSACQEEIMTLTYQNKQIEAELNSLKVDKENSYRELQQLEEKRQQQSIYHADEVRSLEFKLKDLEANLKNKIEEIRLIERKLCASEDHLASLKTTNETLQLEILQKDENTQNLKQAIETLSSELKDLETEKESFRTKLSDTEAINLQRLEEIKALEGQLVSSNDKLMSSLASIKELENRIQISTALESKFQLEIESLSNQLQKLEQERESVLQDLQSERQTAADEHVSMKDKKEHIRVLEDRLKQKDVEMEEVWTEHRSLMDQARLEHDHLKLEICRLQDIISHLEKELLEKDVLFCPQLSDMVDQINILKAEKSELLLKNEALNVEQDKDSARINELNELISNLRYQCLNLENQLRQVESELHPAQQELSKLQIELDSTRKEITDLQDGVKFAHSENTCLQQKVTSITQQNEDLHNELSAALVGRVQDDDAYVCEKRKLNQKLDDVLSKLKGKEEEFHQLKAKLSQQEQQLSELQKEKNETLLEVVELKDKIQELCAKEVLLQEQLIKVELERDSLENKLQEVHCALSEKSEKVDQLMLENMDENNVLKIVLAEKQSITGLLQQKETELSLARENIEALEEGLKAMNNKQLQDKDVLQQTLQFKTDECTKLEAQVGILQKERFTLLQEKDSLAAQNTELSEKKDFLENAMEEMEDQLKTMKRSIESFPDLLKKEGLQNHNLKMNLAENESKLLQAQTKIHQLENEICEHLDCISHLKLMLQDASSEVKKEQNCVSNYKDALESLETEVSSLEMDKASLQADNLSLQSEVHSLNKQVHDLKEEIKCLNSNNLESDYEKINQQLLEEKSMIQEQLQSLKEERKSTLDILSQIRRENEKLNELVQSQEGKIEEMKVNLSVLEANVTYNEEKVKEVDLKHASLLHDLFTVQMERDRLQQQVVVMEEQQAAAVSSRAAMEQEIKATEANYARLQKDNKFVQREFDILKQKYSVTESRLELYKNAESQLNNLKKAYEVLLEEHTGRKTMLDRLDAEKQELLQLLPDAINTADKLKGQLSKEQEANADLQAKLQCLMNEKMELLDAIKEIKLKQMEEGNVLSRKLEDQQTVIHQLHEKELRLENENRTLLHQLKQELEHEIPERQAIRKSQEKADMESKIADVNKSSHSENDIVEQYQEETFNENKESVEDLQASLARTKEEAQFFMEKHNKLLKQIITLKQEKESAVMLVERYKYILQLKNKKDNNLQRGELSGESESQQHAIISSSISSGSSELHIPLSENSTNKSTDTDSHIMSVNASLHGSESKIVDKAFSAHSDSKPRVSQMSLKVLTSTRSSSRLANSKDEAIATQNILGSSDFPKTGSLKSMALRVEDSVMEREQEGSNDALQEGGMMTRRRLSMSKRKSQHSKIDSPVSKLPRLAESEVERNIPRAIKTATRNSRWTSKIRPPTHTKSTTHTAPSDCMLMEANPATASSSRQNEMSAIGGKQAAAGISQPLATITNSPRKTAVKGLQKIPAPSKLRCPSEVPKVVEASKISRERAERRVQHNECKQS